MPGLMGNFGNKHEALALLIGVIAILSSLLFFMQKFDIFVFKFADVITDEYYLYFFAGFALLSGIIHLLTTLGFLNTQ